MKNQTTGSYLDKFKIIKHRGRPANEGRDCVVATTAAAFGISYRKAHTALRIVGRKTGHGMWPRQYIPVYQFIAGRVGKKLMGDLWTTQGRRKTSDKETVKSFLSTHPKGVYIVKVTGHVFCVKDGIILDSFYWLTGFKKRVHFSYKVVG